MLTFYRESKKKYEKNLYAIEKNNLDKTEQDEF